MTLQELCDYLKKLTPIAEVHLTWNSMGYTSEPFNEWASGSSFNGWEGERPTEDEVSIMAKLLKIKHGDSLLDVACGYGRHAISFASHYGLKVTGIDISQGLIKSAIRFAEEKGLKIAYEVMHGKDLKYQNEFNHAIIAFNSFSLFSTEDALVVLSNINRALKKNGKMLTDLDNKPFNCRYGASYRDWDVSNGLSLKDVYFHQDISVEVCRDLYCMPEADRMVEFITFKRIYSEEEIRTLFIECGFCIEEIYGDWDLSPLTQNSPKMILVGVKETKSKAIGLEKGIVRLAPYSPEWKTLYEEEEKLLRELIGEYIIDIQHIGSTSIPDMIAKPILDIGIAIADFEEGKRCIKPIESLGYEYKGENGIPGRHYFVKGNPTTHHIHVVEIDSEEWKKNIIFRDALRKNENLAKEYAELKLNLAEKFKYDRVAYTDGKTDFVNYVLKLADKYEFCHSSADLQCQPPKMKEG